MLISLSHKRTFERAMVWRFKKALAKVGGSGRLGPGRCVWVSSMRQDEFSPSLGSTSFLPNYGSTATRALVGRVDGLALMVFVAVSLAANSPLLGR